MYYTNYLIKIKNLLNYLQVVNCSTELILSKLSLKFLGIQSFCFVSHFRAFKLKAPLSRQ